MCSVSHVAGVHIVAGMTTVPAVTYVPHMADIVSTVPAVRMAAVRQSADGHHSKSHGACRQRDEIKVHAPRDTAGPRAR